MDLNETDSETPVLVVGMPRSGTTWVARAIARSAGMPYLHEPDNEKLDPLAMWAKRKIPRFPWLHPDRECKRYRHLWDRAFASAEPDGRRARWSASFFQRASRTDLERAVATRQLSFWLRAAVVLQPAPVTDDSSGPPPVVKSVHSAFALRWIAARYPFRAIVVVRHPLNVLASWRRLELPDATRPLEEDVEIQRFAQSFEVALPPPDASDGSRQAWRFGVLALALERAGGQRGGWTTVRHEELCMRPETAFAQLSEDTGVKWTPAGTNFLRQSDRPGEGFATERRTADVPGRWRHALPDHEVREILNTVQQFPIDPWNYQPPT